MKPVRTYEVSVYGYTSVLYSARSPAKARARAYRDFCEIICSKTFHEFLVESSVRRVPDPPGAGERIMVAGLPATRCIGHGQYVPFMRDDGNDVLFAHPSDVAPLKITPGD